MRRARYGQSWGACAVTSDLRSRVEVTMHYRVHLHPLDRKKARLKKKTTYTGKLFLEEKYEDCAKFATSTHSATNSTRYRVVEVNERKRESEGEKKKWAGTKAWEK